MEERTEEAFAANERLTVLGRKVQAGEPAPDFVLEYVDLIDMTIRHASLADSAGMVRVLSVVNSLDMPVCRLQTQRWETLQRAFPGGVCLYTVSMDLPHAQAHWQIASAILHQTLSAHQNEQFGLAYGNLLKEWRLLQRAVFVIDHLGDVAYEEYVADQQREPDYEAALKAIERVLALQMPAISVQHDEKMESF